MTQDDPTALVTADAVVSYLNGATKESREFDFLLGEWCLDCARYNQEGEEILRYKGVWTGRSLHDGRMFLDEFRALLEDGTEIASMATLRTYCPAEKRWEMTFLVSHQPNRVSKFTGEKKGDEMCLSGEGEALDGSNLVFRVRFFNISDDGFEWENTVSLDEGITWYRDSTISAKRK